MNKTVCAVVVTYNRMKTLEEAVLHVERQSLKPDTLIIVDNNSNDGTQEYMAILGYVENVHCVYLKSNVGYAGGIARGIRYAQSLKQYDYFWIMDDDTFHKSNALHGLVENMEKSDFDILGLSGANIRFGTKHPIVPTDDIQHADYVLIDGAILRSAIIDQVGVPDERFFMMCEDHEYCKRIKSVGGKVGLYNIGKIERLHLGGGGSFTKATLWRGYYQSRNHILILKKYFSFSDLFGYIYRQLKFIVAAALYAPDRFIRIRLRMIGIWHGIRGIGGKTLDPATLKFSHK